MTFSSRNRIAIATVAALPLLAGAAAAEAASISVDHSDTSGDIHPEGATASHTMSYTNNSSFLVVITTASAKNGEYIGENTPTVTYGGDTLTNGYTHVADHGSSHIHYLANPQTGEHDLSVDFDEVLGNENGTEGFGFGALSLSNVDLANPIADSDTWPTNIADPPTYTMTSDSPGAISAGDFLAVASDAINSLGTPQWSLDDGDLTQLFLVNANEAPADSVGEYDVLTADDISDGDDLVVERIGNKRTGETGGIVFNVIPEPASVALLGLGGLLLLPRRRR